MQPEQTNTNACLVRIFAEQTIYFTLNSKHIYFGYGRPAEVIVDVVWMLGALRNSKLSSWPTFQQEQRQKNMYLI